MLVCAHCGSGSIIPEKEFVYGQGWIERPKCLKCGACLIGIAVMMPVNTGCTWWGR